MREPTECEIKRIGELLRQGLSPAQIVDKMVKANYDRKWSNDVVAKSIDDAYSNALGWG